jgi:nucleotide-binding universal stress UspA family protein
MSDRQTPQVIVGVDRTASGRAALHVAVTEAIRRGVPLHAVRVRSPMHGPVDDYAFIGAAFEDCFGTVPSGIEVRPAILSTPVVTALTERAHHPGDVLVLGAPTEGPRRWWRRLWSRSVVRGCLRRARCPVIVVPVSGGSPVVSADDFLAQEMI